MISPFRALLRVQGRYWLRHKLQAGFCIGGVTLGVALFCAIRLANEGALGAFSGAVDAFLGKATHRVFSPGGTGVPDDAFVRLVALPGVVAASPVLQDRMRIEGLPDNVYVLGIDPLTDAAFRTAPLLGAPGGADPGWAGSSGASPSGGRPSSGERGPAGSLSPLLELLGMPGAALLPAPLAERLHLFRGGTFRGFAAGRWHTFTVAGVFDPPADQAELIGATVVLDVATHQESFGKTGRLDAIRLILADADKEKVETRVSDALPPGLSLERIGQRLERVERMARAFRLNLEALGLFSLLVGAFLIFNAATFSVVQREALVAVQRCIGAPRRAVMVALLGEAAVAGGVGGGAGVLLGWFLAQRMVLNTGATLSEVILDTDALPTHVRLDGGIWLLGLSLGICVAVCGAALPALEAAGVPPLTVLQGSRRISGQPARLRHWGLGALVGALAALALLAAPGNSLALGLAGATAAILAGSLLCPPALWVAGRAMRPFLERAAGAGGLLAARQLSRSLSRTGLASAALMVALALALSIGITVASFRATFTLWLDQTITADLYLSPAVEQRGTPFPAELLAALRSQPFVQELAELRTQRVTMMEREVLVVAVDAAAFARVNRVPVLGAERERAVRALGDGAAWISETLAYPLGLQVGQSLRMPTARGAEDVPIAAIVQNYSAPTGMVYLDQGAFRKLFGEMPAARAALWLKPDAGLEDARQAISRLPGGELVRIALNGQLRQAALRVFDRTFAITGLMSGLAAAVAFIAMISASTALIEERRRIHGYLGAIGVKRRTLAYSFLLESGLLALATGLVSWGVGYVVSAILVFIVNRRAFGWTLQFLPGRGAYFELLALGVVAAIVGSIIPVYRMWRSPILDAIREE